MDKAKERILEKLGYMFYIFNEYPGDAIAQDTVPEIRGIIETLVDFGRVTEEEANAVKAAVAEIDRTFWNDFVQGRKTKQWRKKYAKAIEMVKAL